jgi:8-oxo-dGTP pyrophosphatase MutT (NUDIX family)
MVSSILRRKSIASAVLLMGVLQVFCVSGETLHMGAGVIAFTEIQGETYVLLADHVDSDRGWATFGGSRNDGESPAETASREFREETRCVYERPTEETLAGLPTVSIDTFVSYVFEVPFVPAQVFSSRTPEEDCIGEDFEERGPWIWVPLDEIVACLAEGDSTGSYRLPAAFVPDGTTAKLWANSADILREAISSGLLP